MAIIDKLRKSPNERKIRLKYSLTKEAHSRLKAASDYTEIEMSSILEELIMRYIPPAGEMEGRIHEDEPFDLAQYERELRLAQDRKLEQDILS